jgi:hypothetical protein
VRSTSESRKEPGSFFPVQGSAGFRQTGQLLVGAPPVGRVLRLRGRARRLIRDDWIVYHQFRLARVFLRISNRSHENDRVMIEFQVIPFPKAHLGPS